MTDTFVSLETASQPDCWRQMALLLPRVADLLPRKGERVAVVGCGTSWFMAMAYAALRESAGFGETDAFAASEMPRSRDYQRIVAITRSGTTTEVIETLQRERETPNVVITGVPDKIAHVADTVIDLSSADERSVLQTRFATSALALLRGHLGHDIEAMAVDAEKALAVDTSGYLGADQITFLGRGWTVGIAHEAALKTREAAQFWAEAYPAKDYRHGPIAIAEPGRLVWSFGTPPDNLDTDVAATGARLVTSNLDPQAHLVIAQRLAVGLAVSRGLNPDQPRHLTRSVVLPAV